MKFDIIDKFEQIQRGIDDVNLKLSRIESKGIKTRALRLTEFTFYVINLSIKFETNNYYIANYIKPN